MAFWQGYPEVLGDRLHARTEPGSQRGPRRGGGGVGSLALGRSPSGAGGDCQTYGCLLDPVPPCAALLKGLPKLAPNVGIHPTTLSRFTKSGSANILRLLRAAKAEEERSSVEPCSHVSSNCASTKAGLSLVYVAGKPTIQNIELTTKRDT